MLTTIHLRSSGEAHELAAPPNPVGF